MLYKPKYCCQCGEDIERVNWKLWSSRRFCQLCETEVGHHDWMPRVILGVGVVLSVFSLGSYLQTPENALDVVPRQVASQPQIYTNKDDRASASQSEASERTFLKKSDTTSDVELPTKQTDVLTKKVIAQENRTGQLETSQNKAEIPVYFCGVETKKGTPCSRKMKGGGRCWQHKGR